MRDVSKEVQCGILLPCWPVSGHGQRPVHCGVRLPSGLHFSTGRAQWWYLHRGLLLSHGRDDDHWQRHVHCGVLLSRGLRLRERRNARGYVRHHNLDMHRWLLLSSGRDDGNWRRDGRPLCRRNILPRGCDIFCWQWFLRRGVILPRGRDDSHWGWDRRHVFRGLLLPRGHRMQQRRHRSRHMRRGAQVVHCRKVLPGGPVGGHWQRVVHCGVLVPRWHGNGARSTRRRPLQHGVLLPRGCDERNLGRLHLCRG